MQMENGRMVKLTQWMAAAELWLLSVLALQLITDTVEQLHVALVRVFLKRIDERPRHRSCRLTAN